MARPALIDLIGAGDDELGRYYSGIRRNGSAIEVDVFTPNLRGGGGAILHAKAAPLMDPEGTRIGGIELLHDISDMQYGSDIHPGAAPSHSPVGATVTADTPTLLSRLYLINALKMAHDGISILDLSARLIWANDALVALLGVASHEVVVGRHFTEFLTWDQQESMLNHLATINRTTPAVIPLVIVTPAGKIQVATNISGISDEEGDLIGYMAIIRQAGEARPATMPDDRIPE